MKKTKRQNGITLVALVITIIILLILATISIQSLTNTGLFAKDQEAREKTRNAEENQARTLNEYEDELNKYISGNVKIPIKKVTDNIGSVLSTTDNTELEDAYGNKIVVPAGFKIVSNSDTNNATTVDKGIVIEDATSAATAGSQFVWVPVGTIYTDSEHTEAKKKTIELNRYTFDTNGNPTAQGENVVDVYFNETTSNGNEVAKNIEYFKTSVSSNRGYYIGRYEARKKNEKMTVIKNDNLWTNITQKNASIQSENMYDLTKSFTSDLVNSYAWDTTIVFLQLCGTNSEYSKQNNLNIGSVSETGTTNDVQCNIYDMASNVTEWTTETSNDANFPCTLRGGYCSGTGISTSYRTYSNTSNNNELIGFRPILYINI